ncbi:protein NLRC3-like [Protopterus annectens]|uniref:protein NLRC3-like n=1 Tax=Protopterus annectens TaxID=7888 RepID=UPI001CFBDEE6|nr:protein NLRC3-like [Protopterus annectens]
MRMSAVKSLIKNRCELVDELADHIDSILDQCLMKDVINKDDYENAKYDPGPRNRVRKLLDIIYNRGEDTAKEFEALQLQIKAGHLSINERKPWHDNEYSKMMLKHKQVLKRRNEPMMCYNMRHGERIYLTDYFVNLLLLKGHCNLETKKHELLTFGQQRIYLQEKMPERLMVKPEELFYPLNDKRVPKKLLVTGVAGIGKTMLIQKVVYDFANSQFYSEFDFVFHFTFRDLNLINKPVSLRSLILMKNGHLSKVLDDILANDDKLLIIFDGFDEFKFYTELDIDCYVFDPTEEAELVQIIGSILKGELLSEASVLLTSRPTAINHIPLDCVERFIIITGFSVNEINDFFQKFYQNKELGKAMFDMVKENPCLFTLCYIPAFCYIVCSVFKETARLGVEQPKTMTDIYSHYLMVLIKHHWHKNSTSGNVSECDQVSQAVVGLGKLAYTKLLAHETLFFDHDLKANSVDSCDLVNSFLDRTSVQQPDCVENVFSFTHLTIQEFFAALYYVLETSPLHDIMNMEDSNNTLIGSGYLDLFFRFLSGLLSDRNQKLLSKQINCIDCTKSESYLSWLIKNINKLCEDGAFILNQLHCLFEQRNSSLAKGITPKILRINISDNPISFMDFSVLKYFLDLVSGNILELDMTATNISNSLVKSLQPYLSRCNRIWLGENSLDAEAVKVLGVVLESADCKLECLGLGWTNMGDNELLELYEPLKQNKRLEELWLEGNNIGYDGISRFAEITSFNSTLHTVVLVWNNLKEDDYIRLQTFIESKFIITSFNSDIQFWKEWCSWIIQRCEVSNDEKLVNFLRKVCSGLYVNRTITWVSDMYRSLEDLLRKRIDHCPAMDIKKQMRKILQTLILDA